MVTEKSLMLITMGDPSGIGPEIVLKSLVNPRVRRLGMKCLVVGDVDVLKKVQKFLKMRVTLHAVGSFSAMKSSGVNVYDCNNVSPHRFAFGVTRKEYGRASIDYLRKALSLIKNYPHAALVTAPINKASLNRARVYCSGHTEFLAASTKAAKVAMMLIGEPLRVTLLTRHIPLRNVPEKVTQRQIGDAIELTHTFLQRYLMKRFPKIGVASINPHGGEQGVLGDEEKRIIRPAVAKIRRRYRRVYGPVSSEALFYDAYRGAVDGILCMYHDQGLIPLKMIARDRGVNITLGLPFVRTSPAHGTAFDIAGSGTANPSSMIEAMVVAAKLLRSHAQ
jgi:4-hydroxythreonine-4-phosphate dehydrogenase